MNAKLSVIIPVYNTEQYLKECLDSVCNQTYKNLEIICVNDGSTDGSKDILEQYARKDNRIVLINKNNGGLVSARKAGIKVASGVYATYVDSDDWIEINMLSELMEMALSNDADVVTSGCIREYGDKKSIDGELISKGVYKGPNIHKEFHERMVEISPFFGQNVKVSIVGKVIKRRLLEKCQLKVDNIINVGEDSAVTFPCLLKAHVVVVSGENFYHYRIRKGSVADSKSEDQEMSLKALEQLLEKEFFEYRNVVKNAEQQSRAISMFTRLVIMPETVLRVENGYVYPFNNISTNEKVLVYGAGRFGSRVKEYLSAIGMDIVAVIDQNMGEGIAAIERIKELEFDKVIIAVLKSNLVNEIRKTLEQYNVTEDIIATVTI